MNPLLMIQADMADVQTVVDTATAAAAPERITLWQMALNGGWIMIVLAVLLAMAIYIAVERWPAWSIRVSRVWAVPFPIYRQPSRTKANSKWHALKNVSPL